MGGISKYQQAFFSSEFIKNEPQSLPYVHQLHALILDQVCFFFLETNFIIIFATTHILHSERVE